MNVFYEEDGSFKVASIMSESPAALQVESLSGKRSKIKTNNVLMQFEAPLTGLMEAALNEAESLDIDFLWECCGEPEFAFEDLASDYYGKKPSPIEAAATAIKLHSAPMYFYRKGKGRYKAAPADTLKLALAAVERKKLQAEQVAVWVAQLNNKQLPEGFAAKADALIYNPDKNSLEWKAIDEAAQVSGRLALSVMADCGLIQSAHDYHLGAFLREMFPSKDGKSGVDFPAYEMPDIPDDLPLATVECFSIDDSTTTEVDDAFSLEALSNGNTRLGIHIAAPSLGLPVDSSLDSIVLSRLSTVYIPGNKITMLPENVVKPFSLDAGEIKPALSLYLEVTSDFEIVAHETRLEKIKVADNLRHDTIEPFFNAQSLDADNGHIYWAKLKLLFSLAEKLEIARGKADPNRAPQIDYSFYVRDGKVQIVPRERGAPIDKLVAELMIYANSHWGGLLKEAGFAGIYRAQTGGKVFMTTSAEPHQGLGVSQYAWNTSPLRRAVDLVNQRQLIAMLNNEPAPYNVADGKLNVIMRNFDQTYSAYSDFQTRMERYWCLQYLIQEQLSEVTATVWRENLVRIDGMFYITKVPSLPELEVGTKVSLDIKHIDTLLMELNCKFKAIIPVEIAESEPVAVVEENTEI
ncbi:ribonuclease catalytic domain-containing protein [Methylotenera versatilis]|uniref:ribonuclease catalytic domain-containing protein n=1 Tax=Methylotenera versatilis TaxID=1055487 RepID=UPI000648595D|nr:RNB domain-containing ribonuclease [Methylotenera versatilis]